MLTITWSSAYIILYYANNKSTTTKDAGDLLVILIAMWMRHCYAGCIARWSTSWASLKATGCCHWASAPHRIAVTAAMVDKFGRKHKTLQKTFLAS